jgi:nitroreductase
MSVIFRRRSIRRYADRPVPGELVEKVLKAGMAAPSAGNGQPWQFVVLDDRAVLNRVTEILTYSQMLKEAGAAIVVCGDLTQEKAPGFWVQDCAAATQNMLLMATDLGLGSVWLGVYPAEERVNALKQLLQLPEPVIPLSIVSLGYPAEAKEPIDRFDQWRVHRNRW